MKCPRCEQDNLSHTKFCSECGTPLGARGATTRPYSELSAENEELRRSLTEALEQQTATSEILRVISSSPTDVQPVFDSIVESAVRLCAAAHSAVFREDRGTVQLVAQYNFSPRARAAMDQLFPTSVDSPLPAAAVIRSGGIFHVADVLSDPATAPEARHVGETLGFRNLLIVPMRRQDRTVGALAVARPDAELLSETQVGLLKTFAEQAVIAIENVRLFKELEVRNRDLMQALDRETSSSEILRVINSSPTNVEPVFDAILANGMRLCESDVGLLFLVEQDEFRLVAHRGAPPNFVEPRRRGHRSGPHTGLTRATRERRPVQIDDVLADRAYTERDRSRVETVELLGARTGVWVPMLKEGTPVGVLVTWRREVRPFNAAQIDVLSTFANQAVIALENVRLFNGMKEALEQQTATSEILRVISSSPTDIQPVLDAVAISAAKICGATDAVILRVEGEETRRVAHSGPIALILPEMRRITRAYPAGRAILEGRLIHIHDTFDADFAREYPETVAVMRDAGWRTILVAPLVREGVAIGVITIRRTEVRPFTDKEIGLLQTFADQAVIAIENVRLFKELEARNRELTTALDQQTATSEILRVISESPTDVQPVFEAILQSAVRLCDGSLGHVFRFDGERLHLGAHHNWTPAALAAAQRIYPTLPNPARGAGRAVLERAIVQIPYVDTQAELQRMLSDKFASGLYVPMLRDGNPIGVIALGRATPGPFPDSHVALLRTFADQAVIAIENVRLFTELQEKNGALTAAHAQVTETLERLTATSEILRVISSSPTDMQPVLDAIAERAARLCNADDVKIHLVDGDMLRLAAQLGPIPSVEARPIIPTRHIGRAVLERRTIHVHDMWIALDEFPDAAADVRTSGARTALATPLLREGMAVGVIQIRRLQVQPFSEKQIALLETFADQAVIAIENVRLFTELQEKNGALTEALEQQTATSEILRVIAASPTDVQPVLEAVAESVARLCDSPDVSIFRVEGGVLHLAVHRGPIRSLPPYGDERVSLERGTVVGRSMIERRTIHISDLSGETEEYPEGGARAQRFGSRAILVVPLLRDDAAIGAIAVRRTEARLFTERQVALLRTFADQAVIAIENVRLFNETKEALERQTATGEILRVIASSPADVQPIFETIVRSAQRLLEGHSAAVTLRIGDEIHLGAYTSTGEADDTEVRSFWPLSISTPTVARIFIDGETEQISDVEADVRLLESTRTFARHRGWRSRVVVPMHRDRTVRGAIAVTRREPGRFSDDEIALLKTFADQAVIAIENVRLFRELQARTGELTRSVGELRALGEVSQALSSTLDVDVVLNTIVTRANDLIGADGCTIFEYDEVAEQFHFRATRNLEPRLVELARGTPLRKGDQGILGQLPMGRQAVQVPDITVGSYSSPISDALIEAGYRAVVAVPLIREDHLIGALTMNRKTPGEFPAETIDLLQTFATQSALAIQNARLFREIEIKSRELEAASRHKSEFLANMSHELRTPLNAVIGFSEVLTERMFGELNEKQEEYLKDIHASGQHLLSLINDILDLSKIEAGRMELEVTDFDLPMTIDNAMTLIRERAARRNIALHTTVDERLGQIQGDERKIRQVLLNLLSNAIKFTPEGGRIEVGAKPVNGSIEVSVTDTGVGIAPEDQEAVFEEFRQVGTADKKVEGTGLGLALSRKFIELHRGKIWVKSQVGVGSTFTFTLPVRRGE